MIKENVNSSKEIVRKSLNEGQIKDKIYYSERILL